MERFRQQVTFGASLIGISLLVIVLLGSHQIRSLAPDPDLIARSKAMRTALESVAARIGRAETEHPHLAGTAPLDLQPLQLATVHMDTLVHELQRFSEARAVNTLVLMLATCIGIAGLVVGIQTRREVSRRHAIALAVEQQARAEAERANELKDQFLATVSHELRTPLNAIVGWTELLKTGTLTRDDQVRALDAINRNAMAQAHLVSDLLDVSRLIRGQIQLVMAPVELGALIRQAVDSVRGLADSKFLRLETPGEMRLELQADEARLYQIVWNLLHNAVKFTPAEGTVRVDAGRAGDQVWIEVSDTGEGIAPDILPRIFDHFLQGPTRSRRMGLGLGLAIVRHLVELHGGTVTATSAGEGAGATFRVTLPVQPGP